MKVLLDSNVIIDVIERRKGFFDDSYAVVRLAAEDKLDAFVSAGSISDIYYIIRRSGKDASATRDAIVALLQLVTACDTAASDVSAALMLPIADFEDAIIVATARREKVDFIITRNERDFTGSSVPYISPTDFLARYSGMKADV